MDTRGVNTALGYVLALSITTVLIAMLIMSTTTFVTTQQESVIGSEMGITGQNIVNNIVSVDRLIRMDCTTTPCDGSLAVERTVTLPSEFAGAQYHIDIQAPESDGYPYTLQLRTTNPTAVYTTEFMTDVPINGLESDGDSLSLAGQDLVMRYESGSGKLVIQNG